MTATRTRTRRSDEDWVELARELLPEVRERGGLAGLEDRIGTNRDAFKIALAKLGFDPKGNPMTVEPISGSRESTIAKRVAEARREKEPWWKISYRSELSYNQLIELLAKHGYGTDGQPVGS